MNDTNVVVVRGRVTGDPTRRELASGAVVTQFDLSVADPAGTVGVPVAWFDAPTRRALRADQEVVILGQVRRRFFRSGGATQSRTEVVAERVVDTRRRADVARLLHEVAEGLRTGVSPS